MHRSLRGFVTLLLVVTLLTSNWSDSLSLAASTNALTVTIVSPSSGISTAQTNLTITGTGFQPNATVTVGANALRSVSVIGATRIIGVVPAGLACGFYDLTVTNPGGESATRPNAFRVVCPTPSLVASVPTGGLSDVPKS